MIFNQVPLQLIGKLVDPTAKLKVVGPQHLTDLRLPGFKLHLSGFKLRLACLDRRYLVVQRFQLRQHLAQ